MGGFSGDSKGNNRQRKLKKGRGKQDTSSKGLNISLNFPNHEQRNSNSQITETPRPKVDSSCISIQNYKGQILTQGGGEKDGWVGDVIHTVFLGKAQTLLIQDCNRVQLYLQVTQTNLNSVNKFEIHLL